MLRQATIADVMQCDKGYSWERASALVKGGPCASGVLADGSVLGCGGFVEIEPGVYEGWLLRGPAMEGHEATALHDILKFTIIFKKSFQYSRIQALVCCNNVTARKLFKRLGFSEEAVQVKRFGGKDAIMMAEVR